MSNARVIAVAAVLVMGVVVTLGVLTRDAEGSHIPITLAAVDTNVSGNDADTVGTVEACGEIASVGQSRQIDVVVKGVSAEGLAGAAFDLVYDPNVIKMTTFDGAVMIAGAFTSFSDPVPDADGAFRAEIADLNVGDGYASGDGVVARFTVEAVGSGSTSVYLSDLVQPPDYAANFIDPATGEYGVTTTASGQITVGPTTCASPTPAPTPAPTPVPTPPSWNPPAKKLNNWNWYRFPAGLTTSYWYECGVSEADCRSRWTAPYGQAKTDWNSRPLGISLAMVQDEVNNAEMLFVSVDQIFGQPSLLGVARAYEADFDPCPSTCTVRWGEAWAADDVHVGAYGSTDDRRATVAHEVGHLLGLRHESVNGDESVLYECGSDDSGPIPYSVMAYDCIDPPSIGGEGENWVQDFDVCGVNHKYPSGYGNAGCLDPPTQASYFHSLPPCRALDTRHGIGGANGKLGEGGTISLLLAERCGIASMPHVSAVVLNVTVTQPTHASYLTVYPSDASKPLTSNLNFLAGETRPNSTTSRIGSNGRVNIYNQKGATHLIVDVFGYYSPTMGERFNALSPTRVLDTRWGIGGLAGKIGQGQTAMFTVAGVGGVPPAGQVSSVALNVTVTEPTAGSFLTVYPADLGTRPNASNLNFPPGKTIPNLVIVRVSPDGKLKIYNELGATHVIMDVAGWYTTGPSGELFHAVTPARVLDTRPGTGGHTGKLGAGGVADVRMANAAGLPPAGATSMVGNATITQASSGSFLTLYPSDTARPNASHLNFAPGDTIPNAVIVKVSSGGRIKVYNHLGTMHAIVDVTGWFGP